MMIRVPKLLTDADGNVTISAMALQKMLSKLLDTQGLTRQLLNEVRQKRTAYVDYKRVDGNDYFSIEKKAMLINDQAFDNLLALDAIIPKEPMDGPAVIDLLGDELRASRDKERPFVPCVEHPSECGANLVRPLADIHRIPRCGDPLPELPSVALPNLITGAPVVRTEEVDLEDLYA
jgi:hypothetical protein